MKTDENGQPPGGGFHRRAFLRGSGAVAAATAVGTGRALGEDQDAATKVTPPGMRTIELKVNGQERELKAEPRMTLLEALRHGLGLTGAKPVSVDGSSGASTVFLDGKPVSASTVLVLTCLDKEIQTVESLGTAEGKNMDPVPAAFVEHDGLQCGFCTPGFVMAVRAFLNKYPDATEQPGGRFPVPPHGARGEGHVCFRVPRAELDGWAAHLAAHGVAVESDFEWPNGARSVYVRDPARNSVEFSEAALWGRPT